MAGIKIPPAHNRAGGDDTTQNQLSNFKLMDIVYHLSGFQEGTLLKEACCGAGHIPLSFRRG